MDLIDSHAHLDFSQFDSDREDVLARAQSADPVKAMMLAMEIHGTKSVDLEEADFALVQEAVDQDKLLTNLGKAALLTALSGAKEKA